MTNYGTVNGGDIYFAAALGGSDWSGASEEEKQKALVSATRAIDRLRFKDAKFSDTQDLQFPRTGQTEVPGDIVKATYELANYMLSGVDLELEHQALTEAASSYGDTSSGRAPQAVSANAAAGIPSVVAWRYLQPYLDAVRIRIRRIN